MLQIKGFTHVIHAVRDRPGAEELYARVFDARKFHDGPADQGEEASSLLVFHQACVQVVALPDFQRQVGEDMVLPREGFHGVGLQVVDLEAAAQHLVEHGVRVIRRWHGRLFMHPKDSFGTLIELRDRLLPDDPRSGHGWSTDHWSLEHPLRIQGSLGFSVLVKDAAAARGFYQGALAAGYVDQRIVTEISGRMDSFTLGDVQLRVAQPAEGTPLAQLGDSLGIGGGIFAMVFRGCGLPEVARFFTSRGIGLYPTPDTLRMPHPRAMLGARFAFVDPDPHDVWWTPQGMQAP